MEAPDKMKVADLRSALQERGLDTKGTKPVLVARLLEALEAEKPEEVKLAEAAAKKEAEEAAQREEEEAAAKKEAEEAAKKAAAENGDKEEPMEAEAASGDNKAEKKEEEGKGVKRKIDEEPPYVVTENEPEIEESLVCLDWYNSDLSLKIETDLTTAQPFMRDGWVYCYAGARATHGCKSGKVWFEVKYLDNMDVKVEKETTTFDLRVGWSTNDSPLMLGESELSWCYSSCEGKMAHAGTFAEYGETFGKDDVIGAYLDFGEEEIGMTFTKNGEDQGDAFQIPRKDFPGDTALFPHILTRNVKFQVNFGVEKGKEEALEDWKPKLDEAYVKVGSFEEKVPGTPRIAKREDCEMIMMVGLPGAGKTHWVEKHVAENQDKNYNVISTTEMFKKMTVNGEPRKKVFKGKWDLVIQKATRSLQELIRAASQRRRNVIIDQTNVFPNAQKRKARPFEGFVRRCVVVVPSDEEYKVRVTGQEDAGNKDIPDEAIMEMKANFSLPEEADTTFKEALFIELDREKAKEVVDLYNKVAKEKGYGKKHEERRNNFNKRGRFISRGNVRAGFRGARGFVPRGGAPFRGGRGSSGGYQGRGGMGGPSPWANKNQGFGGGAWNQQSNMGMGGMGMNNMGMGGMGMGGMGMGGMGMNNMGMGGMGMGGMGMNNMGMSGFGGMGGMGMGGMGMNSMGMGGMGSMASRLGGSMGGGMNSYNQKQSGFSGGAKWGSGSSRGFSRGGGGNRGSSRGNNRGGRR